MKILLVQPFKDTALGHVSFPPVGLGYLASAARRAGFHEVRIYDCLKDAQDYRDFMQEVKSYNPDLVGINLFSIASQCVKQMIEDIKWLTGSMVVLGGPHVSSLPERVFNDFPGIDYAIRGEGERPFQELIQGKMTNRINEPYFSDNPDEYYTPAWDLIDPQSYFKYPNILPKSAPVFFSRGCPYSCTFCAAKITSGQRVRWRNWDNIWEELCMLRGKHRVRNFVIEDEGFGTSKEKIMEFCQRFGKIGFGKFAMGTGMRLNIIDQELLSAMKKANFHRVISVGIESGSQRILDFIRKGTDLKLIRDKVSLMDEMGFYPSGNFILGFPTETREEIRETIDLAFKLPLREVSFTALQPLPGTELTKYMQLTKELPEGFDFTKIVPNAVTYAPKGMTCLELEEIRKRAILKFHLIPRHLLWYLFSWRRFKFAVIKFVTVILRRNAR
jgi:radical SAM superfamily enzyme YgiQ (UPF0313 family)